MAPFAWILLTLYNLVQSYGLAIILFTLVTKLLLFFFSFKGKRGIMMQQRLAPKQQALQKKYKDDKAKYQQALTKLYQDEGISPMGGCLWSLLPFPILIALYGVVQQPLSHLMQLSGDAISKLPGILQGIGVQGITESSSQLDMAQKVFENFDKVKDGLMQSGVDVANMIPVNFSFLGLDLSKVPNLPWNGGFSWLILIPLLAGAAAFLTSWASMKFAGNNNPAGSKGMMFISPIMSLVFGFMLPAAMGLYWMSQSLFTIIQEYVLVKHFTKVLDAEDARKAELEARRKAAEDAQKEEDRKRRAERIAAQGEKKKPKKYRVSSQPKSKEQQSGGEE